MKKLGKLFVYAGILAGIMTMVACGSKFEALKGKKSKVTALNPGTSSERSGDTATEQGVASQALAFITANHPEISDSRNINRNVSWARGIISSAMEAQIINNVVTLSFRISSNFPFETNIGYDKTTRNFPIGTLAGETQLYQAGTIFSVTNSGADQTIDLDIKVKCMNNTCDSVLFVVNRVKVIDDTSNSITDTETTALAVLFSKNKSGKYAIQKVNHSSFVSPL